MPPEAVFEDLLGETVNRAGKKGGKVTLSRRVVFVVLPQPISYNQFMRDIEDVFVALGRSRFRSRFRLGDKEAAYLKQKGLATILEHARDFITNRLAAANPANDGRQTPMKNHPAFIAQHATGTCCRKCLAKWHNIPQGKTLSPEQIDYIIEVLHRWMINQISQPVPRLYSGQVL